MKNEYAGLLPLTLFLALVAAYASLFIGWEVFPRLLYAKHEQPINFNHALHVDELGDCESCHYFREDGSYAGLPSIYSCMDCHSDAMGEDPEEIKFVEQYIYKEREVPWYVYSRQPDCVFFSHAAHVIKGGMDCETCHGDVGSQESTPPYYVNRITGYSRDIWGADISGVSKMNWEALAHDGDEESGGEEAGHGEGQEPFVMKSMKMTDCADCHRVMKGVEREGCFVCHK